MLQSLLKIIPNTHAYSGVLTSNKGFRQEHDYRDFACAVVKIDLIIVS